MSNIFKIILVRVFSDTQNPGYYSIIHKDNCITLLPIIEKHVLKTIPTFMDPDKLVDRCSGRVLSTYYKYSRYGVKPIHNDPRIDLGLYTEESKPSRLPFSKISRGTIIFFMSGLTKYPDSVWHSSYREFRSMLKKLRASGKTGVYIIGGIVVNKVLKIENSEWDKYITDYPILMYSPHYYRLENRDSVAYIGRGFFVNPPLKIATFAGREYKITRRILELIGRDNVLKLIKQNFRKTSIIEVEDSVLEKILSSRIDYV